MLRGGSCSFLYMAPAGWQTTTKRGWTHAGGKRTQRSVEWPVPVQQWLRSEGGAQQRCVHSIRQACTGHSPSRSSACRLLSSASQAVVPSGVSGLTYSASSAPPAAAQAVRQAVTSAAASRSCSVDALAGRCTSSSRLRTWRAWAARKANRASKHCTTFEPSASEMVTCSDRRSCCARHRPLSRLLTRATCCSLRGGGGGCRILATLELQPARIQGWMTHCGKGGLWGGAQSWQEREWQQQVSWTDAPLILGQLLKRFHQDIIRQ